MRDMENLLEQYRKEKSSSVYNESVASPKQYSQISIDSSRHTIIDGALATVNDIGSNADGSRNTGYFGKFETYLFLEVEASNTIKDRRLTCHLSESYYMQ